MDPVGVLWQKQISSPYGPFRVPSVRFDKKKFHPGLRRIHWDILERKLQQVTGVLKNPSQVTRKICQNRP